MTTSFCQILIPNPAIAIKTQEFLKGRSAQYPRSSGSLCDTVMNALFMKIQEHFIHEKIAIPNLAPRTSRPRLLKLHTDNLHSANATVINGRAGSGKSVLAADFARHVGRAVAWYKVEAADNDLRVFCEYLAAAVRRQRPSIDAKALLELTETVESDRAELLAEAFVFQLSETRAEPLLVVIEDLHQVYDGDWVVSFFRRLLPLLPADVHVLITCRSLPPTPLWRMRSKQMLRLLDESALAFTPEEALSLFATYGLSGNDARAARTATKGRAATFAESAATTGRPG